MKTIYIMRHAKSSWDVTGISDRERPLLEKGKNRTQLIVRFLVQQKIKFDLIISSDAVRAYETAVLVANGIGYPTENIRIDRNIYMSDEETLFTCFDDLPKETEHVLLVGHNPSFTNFANYFLKQQIDWLPTSGIVSISFKTDDWHQVADKKPITNFVIFPKQLSKGND